MPAVDAHGLREAGEIVEVRRGYMSSWGHFKAWPRTSDPLSPYTLRKYGALDGGLPGDPGSSLGGLVIFLRLKASTAAEALGCGL